MKEKKRQFILDAADRLITRFGVRKTGVDEIAKLARVAKGTLYNYFGSKEGIIRELIDEKLSSFESLIDKTIQNAQDPLDKIKLAACARFRFLLDNPAMAGLLFSGERDENIDHLEESLDNSEKGLIARLLAEAKKRDALPDEDIKGLADTLQYMIKGLEQKLSRRFESVSIDGIESEINRILSFIFKGQSGTSKQSH
jgi:AcrR family transcriptional regulator